MLQLQRIDFGLGGFGHHAFAMQFTVRARMRLIAGRQQVGGDITLSRNIGDDLDLFINIGKTGEKFSVGIAFQNVPRHLVASGKRLCQPFLVRFIQEDLCFQHLAGLGRNGSIITQRQIKQHLDRRAALHV